MRNRWLIALAAVGIHISIDSVYAWSVLTRPIMAEMGFTLSETTWTFLWPFCFWACPQGSWGGLWKNMARRKAVFCPWPSSAPALC